MCLVKQVSIEYLYRNSCNTIKMYLNLRINMPKSIYIPLLIWNLLLVQVACNKLKKILQQPDNTLEDYSGYRHATVIHFNIPEYTVAAEFKFIAKEAKTGGIGYCKARNVSIYLKSGSLPLVNPDGSKISATLVKQRNRYYSLPMESSNDENTINIKAPSPGDWYAIAFRSFTDPNNEKITQQGLGASCDTVLNAELSLESSSVVSWIDYKTEYNGQLSEKEDSLVLQFLVSKNYKNNVLNVTSSCGENCQISIHVTSENHLIGKLINKHNFTESFRSYENTVHYITLQLISGNTSDVSIRLSGEPFDNSDEIQYINFMRRTIPEFFKFDFEFLIGNETKPSPLNLTVNVLSIIGLEIGRVFDVGGTLSIGLKFMDDEDEDEKETAMVIGCISLGYYSNITALGNCVRRENTTGNDVYLNSTNPVFVHIPYPEPGIWYLTLRAFCPEKNCECAERCLNGSEICAECNCLKLCSSRIETAISSSPCIADECNSYGKCLYYMSGGTVFSACNCFGGYRGFDCADDTYVLSRIRILMQLLMLTISNIGLVASVYVAFKREYYTEAIVYASAAFFSTSYHACEAGGDIYSICITKLAVLQFCDFFNALLSIWVTLVAMAAFRPTLTAFCQIFGAIVLAFSAQMDRTALWVFLLPAITGSVLITFSWGYKCKRTRTYKFPQKPYRNIHLPIGLTIVCVGLILYAFLQTRRNYYIIHSLWHICVALGVIFLLPERQHMT